MIAVRSLTKRFGRVGSKHAADAISVTIPEGKLFSLLGQSGGGKTTTLRMIAGIEEPTSGAAGFDPTVQSVSAARGGANPPLHQFP